MRVMVAGATGAIGTRLVPLLVAAGHTVTGLTRSISKTETLARAGAVAVVVDALDAARLRKVALDARPEVIVHEMTAIDGASDLTQFDRAFAATNRLRTEGLDGRRRGGRSGRAVSLRRAFAAGPTRGPEARSRRRRSLDPSPPREFRNTLEAIRHRERGRGRDHVRRSGAALRRLLRTGSGLFDGPMIDLLRRRRAPLIGDANGWWSFLHVEDAAQATALAVEKGAPGLYNIVDDDPAPVREWLPALARMIDAKPPRRIPRWLARLAAGEHMVAMMTTNRAGSNLKVRRELGWTPAHPSWRQGFAEVIAP